MKSINLRHKLGLFSDQWHPRIIAQVNDMHVKLVRLSGDFVWHSHETEDELFLVIEGGLTMRIREPGTSTEREERVEAGECIVIPHGVEHQPVADPDTAVLLLEPATTINTGDAGGDRTREAEWI